MEEILHHLGCIEPCKQGDKLPIHGCGIFSINSNEEITQLQTIFTHTQSYDPHHLFPQPETYLASGFRVFCFLFYLYLGKGSKLD